MSSENKLAQIAEDYLSALLNKDRQQAEHLVFKHLDEGVPIKDIYLHVFQPAQWKIGLLWQQNKITVAMEHYCTAATQFIMTRLYDHIFSLEKNGMNLVSSSISGELHELGIRMVSDFFEMEGWNTFYLGANTTKDGIVAMIEECKADLLAISATIYFHIDQVTELISYIKNKKLQKMPLIMVGGNAFNSNPELYKEIGADLYAKNAQEAINTGNKIFSLK